MPTSKENVTFYACEPVSEYLFRVETMWGSKSRSALMNQILLMWILLDKLDLLEAVLQKAAITQGCVSVEGLREIITSDEAIQRLSSS